MQPDNKMIQVAAEKAKEQSLALTKWAQEEFKLPPEYRIVAKVTLSIKRIRTPKIAIGLQGLTFDQKPTPKDWDKVINLVERLAAKAKDYKHSKGMWREMISDLKRLRRLKNTAYVRNATRLNLYLQKHGVAYRLMRADAQIDNNTLYSLLAAKPILTQTT